MLKSNIELIGCLWDKLRSGPPNSEKNTRVVGGEVKKNKKGT